MSTRKAFITRHPVLSFYVLTFAISWGGFLAVIGGPGSIPGDSEHVARVTPLAMLAWLVGPSISSLVMTGLTYGREGYRALLARAFRWRVGAGWYAVALLTSPLLLLAILVPASQVSAAFLPAIVTTDDLAGLLLFGFVVGLIGGGILEELGWTGFATPTLRRNGVVFTGLLVGVLWGALHLPVFFWLAGSSLGLLPPPVWFPVRGIDALVGVLVAFRVLMVWVYEQTESQLLASMMHASFAASAFILSRAALAGTAFLVYCVASSTATWAIVGAVALFKAGRLARPRLRVRVA
jgi:membrane protease YdiL (CAAX protease family)